MGHHSSGYPEMLKPTFLACFGALIYLPSFAAAGCGGVTGNASSTDPYWMNDAALTSASKSAYQDDYKVFRNVKNDYHAVGDGIADDTDAINNAISEGNRCGERCNSSTITPAIVFFPPGTYRVTKPIIPFYFTSLVGDYNQKPTLVADAGFVGTAVIGESSYADPYSSGGPNADGAGVNWWTNQNNFFRSVRNFVIDVSAMPSDQFGTGIHWQVGQTNHRNNQGHFIDQYRLQDVQCDWHQTSRALLSSYSLFMENGSGGFMSDLTFDGGAFGMWISNQQFTIRNVKITNAVSAIYQWWDWGFTWQNIQISNCQVGFDLRTGGLTLGTQTAAGVLIVDSQISATGIGIRMSSSQPSSLGGSVVLDNVGFSDISTANIQDSSGTVVAANAGMGLEWFQGNVYTGTSKQYLRGSYTPYGSRSEALTDSSGAYVTKSRPQYGGYQPSQFATLMTSGLGAMGDGVSDDTLAINNFLSTYSGCSILLFETGTYLVTDTIFVPAGTQMVGAMYAVIMGAGPNFADPNNPRPVIQVGKPGDVGVVEMSDFVISTMGGSAGAIGIEWNVEATSQGAAGMWDVHVRLGGAAGTNITAENCAPLSGNEADCTSAFLGLHITETSSGYFENVWVWNADHDLDDPNQSQINSYSGRGVLIESINGPVWLVGTASEHHVIYQYAFNNAENIYAGLIQTETPYFQPTPSYPSPFSTNLTYGDPSEAGLYAWGLVITNSVNVFVYGAGLYSFFQSYDSSCVPNRNCQESMVLIDEESAAVYLYQLTTAGSTNMISYPGNVSVALQADNIDGFASTISLWVAVADGGSSGSNPGGGGTNSSNPGGGSTPGNFTFMTWNPNPYPSPGAVSETFVVAGDSATATIVIPIPTTSTVITANGQFISLAPGGTPVSALLPSSVSELNAITPTWSFNIVPPTAGPITFTAPISGSDTFSTVIPSPSNGVVTTVTGPEGEVWSLSGGANGPSIVGTLPTDVGILGGTTPTAVTPMGWLGPWTNPVFPFSTTTGQPVQSNTFIPWNPNPVPPSGAVSETFVCSGTTTSFPLPTGTTTISAGGATITLDKGGIPILELLDPGCSEVGGIVPTWSQDIIPPSGASIITFTGPLTSTPTWISSVPVPSHSDSPGNNVNGPPGDKNRCNSNNFWSLLFNLVIDPCLPLDVGIVGGTTPRWKGPWTAPISRPTPTPTTDNSQTGTNTDTDTDTRTTDTMSTTMSQSTSTSQSSSSSGSSSSPCPTAPIDLTLPDEAENADWNDDGTDPDQRRRAAQINSRTVPKVRTAQHSPSTNTPMRLGRALLENTAKSLRTLSTLLRQKTPSLSRPTIRYLKPVSVVDTTHNEDQINAHHLFRRFPPRQINIPTCSLSVSNNESVSLGAGSYARLDPNGPANSVTLVPLQVNGPPQGGQSVNQEHVFELGYISQFYDQSLRNFVDCAWVETNLINYVRADGSTMGLGLVRAIDVTANMVWVDKPLNQAKSNVVNQNSANANNPPQKANMDDITKFNTWNAASDQINRVEFFLRNLAAIGQYFGGSSQIFNATALSVQNLLSEITPSSVPKNDASLPLLFNQWLTNLINTYPNGCTSRGTNAWNYYQAKMQAMATKTGQPIPNCFHLIRGRVYNPSTFTPALLLPPAPVSPRCNVPGTKGYIFYQEAIVNGQLPIIGYLQYGPTSELHSTLRDLISNRKDRYAVGSGASISGQHLQGSAISRTSYPSCAGSYVFDDVPAGTAGYSTAEISFDCGNDVGGKDIDGLIFVMDGQDLPALSTTEANTLCVNEYVAMNQGSSLLAISQLGFNVAAEQ
ncbi:Glucan 1,3-beta-glucosidase [Mycena sanguinolenta]|uniref:Glucan 1,3-beta-glucosidase n=1 Tax=Mycena sanguinolenta TaxID=230812 RepID=A0A8H7DH18_9AGAR|nr:Glucan 1,3-beta-glucosidase [Mycena sanguinolenta]